MNQTRFVIPRTLSAVCGVVAVIALACLLWLIRFHYFNATNAGHGDAEQDRRQALLGWGIVVLSVVAVGCILVVAARSRLILISVVTGAAVTGLAMLCGKIVPPVAAILAFPAIFANLYTFGIHSGGPAAFGAIINGVFFSAVTFLALKIVAGRRQGWWPRRP